MTDSRIYKRYIPVDSSWQDESNDTRWNASDESKVQAVYSQSSYQNILLPNWYSEIAVLG